MVWAVPRMLAGHWSFVPFNETPALLLLTISPLSQLCRHTSGAIETLFPSVATHRFQSESKSPSPKSCDTGDKYQFTDQVNVE